MKKKCLLLNLWDLVSSVAKTSDMMSPAVADVFTAVMEDRPYRKGMGREAAIRELRGMVFRGELDGTLVDLLIGQFDAIHRAKCHAKAVEKYEKFRAALTGFRQDRLAGEKSGVGQECLA